MDPARPLRVLIVEDREDDAVLAVRALSRDGFEVIGDPGCRKPEMMSGFDFSTPRVTNSAPILR